jgi:hypothetical protein
MITAQAVHGAVRHYQEEYKAPASVSDIQFLLTIPHGSKLDKQIDKALSKAPPEVVEERLEELVKEKKVKLTSHGGYINPHPSSDKSSATEHTTEDHIKYTKEQIAKNLILLEEHFKNYPCNECMNKHLMGITGYAEEGIGMDQEPIFHKAKEWANRKRKMINEKEVSDKEFEGFASEARDLRRSIQEGAHLDIKEALDQESGGKVILRHDHSSATEETPIWVEAKH